MPHGRFLQGPREWVPYLTDAFQSGRIDVLVGTRGLLGEGWDAPAANVVIDLTAATTSTAVVQIGEERSAVIRSARTNSHISGPWPPSMTPTRAGTSITGGWSTNTVVTLAPDDEGRIIAGVEHLDDRAHLSGRRRPRSGTRSTPMDSLPPAGSRTAVATGRSEPLPRQGRGGGQGTHGAGDRCAGGGGADPGRVAVGRGRRGAKWVVAVPRLQWPVRRRPGPRRWWWPEPVSVGWPRRPWVACARIAHRCPARRRQHAHGLRPGGLDSISEGLAEQVRVDPDETGQWSVRLHEVSAEQSTMFAAAVESRSSVLWTSLAT